MPDPQPSSTPKVIGGRFRVDRLLGRGGMGEVWAARNLTTGRDVALKMIIGAAVGSAEQTRRFLREAKAATAIQHPNVIEVLDVFEDEEGTPVMVMELLKGETLSALRKRAGALPLHEVATILLPVAAALRAAHEKGIVHRDLKPDNIFLSEPPGGGPRVSKVLDFGIAKVVDPTSISGETQGGATNTGSILGTPHYMAMEQAMSVKDIDHRADIWAMGVILFEALTGRRPLEFENLGQMYTAFLQGSVPSIREVVPDLPADFGAVVDRCLQKERDARLADLGPLIEVLGRYVDPSVQGARAGGTVVGELPSPGATTVTKAAVAQTAAATPAAGAEPAPPRGRSMLALGVGAAALLALGAGAMVLRSRPTLPPAAPEAATASVALAPASAAPTVSAVAPGASAVATVVPVGTVVPATTLSPSAPRPPASARGAGRVPGATASSEPAREAAKPSLGGVIEKPPF